MSNTQHTPPRNTIILLLTLLGVDKRYPRDVLDKMSDKDLQKLYTKEMEDYEKKLIFNQPEANVDIAYWSKQARWSAEECVSLALEKDPRKVNWDEVQPHISISSFAKKYEEIRNTLNGYISHGELSYYIRPREFITWAKQVGINFPKELEHEVNKSNTKNQHKDFFDNFFDNIDDKYYSSELHTAISVYRSTATKRNPNITFKQQAKETLDKHYAKLSKSAKERIITLINPTDEKKGGRHKQRK